MANATPTQGRVLGDFVIEREIGRGGMGVVFEAAHLRSGRRVALKVLEAHLTLLPSAVERFLREAHAVAGLRHPNIVPVERVGECDGARFFAMELIDGPSLADVVATLSARARGEPQNDAALPIPQRRFATDPFTTAARTVAQVARALHHAHRRGILHRDVKPSNILLRRNGTPLLIDFGLVFEEGLPALTRTGDLVGSPYYVAPEQCGGRHAAIDRRVDVYALGVVLYELLTLRRPYEGENARDVIEKIESGSAPPPRQLRPDLPRDLDTIVRRAMALRPDDRYATAAEFARDLELFVAGRKILGGAGGWRRAAHALARDHGGALATAAGLLMVVAGALFWRARHPAPRDAQALATARLKLLCELPGVEAELYSGLFARGEPIPVVLPQKTPLALAPGRYSLRARAAGHEALVLEGDHAFELAAGESALKSLWLPPLVRRFDVVCDDLAAPPATGDVDGDGSGELVLARRDGSVSILADDGTSRPFAHVDAEPYALAVARDPAKEGARVAVAAQLGNEDRVYLFDGGGARIAQQTLHGRVCALLGAGERDGGAPCWFAATQMGDVAAVGALRPAARDVGAALRVLAQLKCEPGENGRPRLRTGARLFLLRTPSGADTLALADATGVQLIGITDGGALELRARAELPVRAAEAVRSADGDRLALALDDGRLRILDPRGGVTAEFQVGECLELTVARRGDEPLFVVATSRALEGFGGDGSPRFTLPIAERIDALAVLDVDRDGDDEIAALLEGRLCTLWASERDVRFKAGRDVRDFCVVPDEAAGARRIVVVERGDTLALLAADGRRLANLQLPAEVTTLVAGASLWCGASDGLVRELRCEREKLVAREDSRPAPRAVTAIATGAVGDDGAPRIVRGDAGGGVDFTLLDGSGDARFVPPSGRAVRFIAAGDLGGGDGAMTVAVFDGGMLLRFVKGATPTRPLDLGRECTALALFDVDGDGRREIVVALEGGELLFLDGAGTRRGVVRAPSTIGALAVVPASARADAPLAVAGTVDGALLRIGRNGALTTVAKRDAPIVAVAFAAGADAAGSYVAALTGRRACVFTESGERRLDVAARGTRIALCDCDGDGVPELLHVDGEGALAVRSIRAESR